MIENEAGGQGMGEEWRGLRELDEAITRNRLSAYLVKKAWTDPWERKGLIAFGILLAVFIAYVAIYDGLIEPTIP